MQTIAKRHVHQLIINST